MEPVATTLPAGARFEDRYEILGELGAGSFGTVYEARQLSTGQSVALKLVAARDGIERFRRELRICAALSHPHIVQLIDSGETREGELYVVFGRVPGETLAEALAREGALGVKESLRLMTQVLDALACAHAHGIVHRDLKPANLMLSGSGARRNALVLDFGLGGLADGPRRRSWRALTQSREFVGTPFYAAPEQLAGAPPTPRADLYAWGLILIECLTGQHPLESEHAVARLVRGEGGIPIPDWLQGHRLGRLLESVTHPDAEQRSATAEVLIEALDEIADGELPASPDVPAPLRDRGERRQLTLMFCDLVDSSELSQQLDPEAYSRVLHGYRRCCETAVARYDGYVAQHLGDGVLVYFGFPQAHEDDAERAVRAARDLVREVAALHLEEDVALSARVGIHTGPVVVAESRAGDRRERLALGAAPNVAARLQAFAEPGAVVMSEATRRLVAGLFVTDDLGTPPLKGIREALRVYRVREPSGVTSRLERAPGLTPFVGRERELGLLCDRFEEAREKRGQAVWIAGEAGIGKSRLVRELRERLRETPHRWLECRASPYAKSSALHPVVALLERRHRLGDDLAAEEKLARLERSLASAGLPLAENLPLLASLLSLPQPERFDPLDLGPKRQRQRTLEALRTWVLELGERQPVVLVVEDLHWSDPTTLEWLELVIEQIPTAGVLLVTSFRPEFEPGWAPRSHLLPISLGRLGEGASRQLVDAATAGSPLPEPLRNRIAARSDGIPLFAEELARSVVESSGAKHASLSGLEIPETLQDSLMARLDRLGTAKPVAQLAAALGREFTYPLLEAVAPLEPRALRAGLGRLADAELVYQRGTPPDASYTFRHALVQDAAYSSLLTGQRRELHRRIADALEQRFPDRAEREPELLAHHCARAARPKAACDHFERAGRRAAERFAHAEAVDHLEQAIAQLRSLPESPERSGRELRLLVDLGPSMAAARGFTDGDVERVYERARALSREVGETPELFPAMIGLSTFHAMRGQTRNALDLAERALRMAQQSGDPGRLRRAHSALGTAAFGLSQLPRALEHLEQATRIHAEEARAPDATAAFTRGWAAQTLFLLGYPDRARRESCEAVALAREADPLARAMALAHAATLHYRIRERGRARERAEEAIEVARREGLPFPLALATAYRGWALGGARGLAEVREGLARFAALEAEERRPHGLLADVYRELGRTQEAFSELEAALASRSEARTWEPDLYRLRAELHLQRGAAQEAERDLRRALAMPQSRAAPSLDLRLALSLARLLCDRGRGAEARELLEPRYATFEEGFDTADLCEAAALLAELA